MVIDTPEITESGDKICVSARIEIQTPGKTFPGTLWFKFPKSYTDYITDRTDCFAASLLPLAMRYGEDLEIHGPLSPRLAHGMREYLRIQHLWKPNEFKLIEINYTDLKMANATNIAGGVGCAFSGGVDSFYTLWSHLPQHEKNPGYRISHCLMINGFDVNSIPEDAETFSNKTRQLYEPMMNRLGLQLLVSHTNIWQFMDRGKWQEYMYTFGSILTASALALGHLFSRFYIASSFQYTQLFPWGSHPLLDNLLSTEATEIIHDGAHLTRIEKIAALSQWPETYSRLRTCLFDTSFIIKTAPLENCCRCERCIQMMSVLDMLGVLDKYTVFPKPLERKYIRKVHFFDIPEKGKNRYLYAQETIDSASKLGRRDVVFDLGYAILRNTWFKGGMKRVRRSIKRAFKKILRAD
jgi:hypothetical protein